jgi:hypothetical protein
MPAGQASGTSVNHSVNTSAAAKNAPPQQTVLEQTASQTVDTSTAKITRSVQIKMFTSYVSNPQKLNNIYNTIFTGDGTSFNYHPAE